MTPLEYLREEYSSVHRALDETLRHEFAPDQSYDFYEECRQRLSRIGSQIEPLREGDQQAIAANLTELGHVATWISLIERSYLGEFSWPFAYELRQLASSLLSEKQLSGESESPIVHVVSEAWGYRIINEEPLPLATSSRRFAVIQFPRALKYHVLLHAIFGHELGHAALQSTINGDALVGQVQPSLCGAGPLANSAALSARLLDKDAPSEIKALVERYQSQLGVPFAIHNYFWELWIVEFISDLCGLLLFGPAFAAAFRALLKPKHPNPLKVDILLPTHPPYAARDYLISRAMHLLGWDKAIAEASSDREVRNAEKDLLVYLQMASYPDWAKFFIDTQIADALSGIRAVFGKLVYDPPNEATLVNLVRRLTEITPPIIETIGEDGDVTLRKVPFTQMLYAGWTFWTGRTRFPSVKETPSIKDIPFFEANRLCNHAMLQQQAINRFIK